MLYRNLAPISNEVWEEIDERAKEVLRSYLSARRVVHVDGPKGFDHNVLTDGRLANSEELDNGVCYGNYKVQPLVESRIEFDMDRWELDNLQRGAKDIDYEPLENAMKEIALFEEDAIYNGLENAIIDGINNSMELDPIDFGKDANSIMESITKGLIELRKNFAQKPFSLVVNEEAYKRILSSETAYPLDERIKRLIGGDIIFSHVVDGAYLLPVDHDDLELTIGRDFSIGYQDHDAETVRFFVTESFTFRVLDSAIIVKFNL